MDTAPAVSGKNVNPRIIENYDGNDIVLNQEKNIVTRVSEFPMLKDCKGKCLIVTDGTTLLGGDDKAGVAEIMAAAKYLLTHFVILHIGRNHRIHIAMFLIIPNIICAECYQFLI